MFQVSHTRGILVLISVFRISHPPSALADQAASVRYPLISRLMHNHPTSHRYPVLRIRRSFYLRHNRSRDINDHVLPVLEDGA